MEQTYRERKCQRIDGNDILSGIVLHGSRQESLGEEKSRKPKCGRFAVFKPILKRSNRINFRRPDVLKKTVIYKIAGTNSPED